MSIYLFDGDNFQNRRPPSITEPLHQGFHLLNHNLRDLRAFLDHWPHTLLLPFRLSKDVIRKEFP